MGNHSSMNLKSSLFLFEEVEIVCFGNVGCIVWAPKQNPLVLFWSKEADFEGVSKRQLKCCAS